MKVIVCGSRFWNDAEIIKRRLDQLPRDTVIVHGACRGADMMADALARALGFKDIRPYPAEWKKYGLKAGPVRNRQMWIEEGPIDLVIGFHENIQKSSGTKHMLSLPQGAGTPWELIGLH